MSQLRRDIEMLDRAEEALWREVPTRRAVDPSFRVGEVVRTSIPGFGGSSGIMEGVVKRARDGTLRVFVKHAYGLMGGTTLRRARSYPLGSGWVRSGEELPHIRVQREAEERSMRLAALSARKEEVVAAAIAESRRTGARHLDDVTPRAGMRIRNLRTGETASIVEVDPRFGPLYQPDDERGTGMGGRIMGRRELLAEWVVES